MVSVADINCASDVEDEEELEEDSDDGVPSKLPGAKRVMAENSDNGTYDEEDDEEEEQEEGQI